MAITHNPIYRFLERTDFSIRGKRRSTFAIVKVQQYSTATGGASRILDTGGQLARFNKRFQGFGLKKDNT